MQIAGIFFRQLKQKAQAILCVLTSIFVIDAGKRAGKMYAQELISAYLNDPEESLHYITERCEQRLQVRDQIFKRFYRSGLLTGS